MVRPQLINSGGQSSEGRFKGPGKGRLFSAHMICFLSSCWIVADGQTARSLYRSPAAFPAALFQDAILHDRRYRRVPPSYRKHLFSVDRVVLCIAVLKCDFVGVVKFASLLAIRASWFCVYDDFQLRILPFPGQRSVRPQSTKAILGVPGLNNLDPDAIFDLNAFSKPSVRRSGPT